MPPIPAWRSSSYRGGGGGNADNLSGGQADNVFFGSYYQSNGTTKDPVKWRVLSNAGGQLFLLSDQNLEVFQYHTELENVTWETSTMRSWLNGYDAAYTDDNFLDAAFSSNEQAAIAVTLVVNDDNAYYGTDGGNNTTDSLFLLSLDEAEDRRYFPRVSSSRYAANTAYVADGGKLGSFMYEAGELDSWWLRSPGPDNSMAAFVDEGGAVIFDGNPVNNKNMAVRPAFNLNLSSVLFTSAVGAGGKSAGANGLAAVADYSGSDWKLTLLDSSRTFAVSNAMLGGNTVTFSYSGAQTGVNEYLSAVIMDQNNGTIAYYGRILQPGSASGTASLTLPSGVTLSDTTKLYVFNEQYNGDKRTDYASKLIALSPASMQLPSITTTALPGGKVGEAYSQTLAARGSVPITWSLESGSLPAGLTLSGDTISGTPTAAGTFTFTVKASNAAGSDSRELSIVIASVPVDPDPDKQPPVIIAPTADEKITAEAGGTVTLSVSARNARFYQWYVNDGSGFKAIPGATDADCTLSDLTAQHDGYRYYCVVTNAYGTVTSPVFTLDIPSTPVPATPPRTGDSTPLALYALLALFALASLAALTTARRQCRG